MAQMVGAAWAPGPYRYIGTASQGKAPEQTVLEVLARKVCNRPAIQTFGGQHGVDTNLHRKTQVPGTYPMCNQFFSWPAMACF